MSQFSELGLAAPILQALTTEGYTTPTPIQAQAIPHVLAGKDVLGIAQTGTGKTAAFALPILQRIAAETRAPERNACRALILSPTRELATQIAESFRTYGRHLRLSIAVIFGGVSMRPQVERVSRGVDIVVATPGRLIDHLEQGTLRLNKIEIFVLDEADQMLDLGFVQALRRIVPLLPKKRQSLFFSATMPREIGALANDLLDSPVKVAVAPVATTVERVDQSVIFIETARKRFVLSDLIRKHAMDRALVFTRTKRGADKVVRSLEDDGIGAAAIHGNKSQGQRERALAAFKAGQVKILVATDIAARGIDVEAVSHVVNYELPNIPETYVHRIGRTARAGASGRAISLCDGEEQAYLRAIEKLTRQTIPAEDRRDPSAAAASARDAKPAQRQPGTPGRDREMQRNETTPRPFGAKRDTARRTHTAGNRPRTSTAAKAAGGATGGARPAGRSRQP